jgi:hypothetical protein
MSSAAGENDLPRWFNQLASESNPMQLGERQFTDGTTRPVYRSDDGCQYFPDDDGEPE